MPPLSEADLQHVLDHTGGLWEELRGGRIFVTGGTGFFGCWLLETFARANEQLGLNAQLLALTRSPEAFARKAPHLAGHPAITLWRGDVRDFDFPGGKFSHVIHAGTASGAPVDPLEMFDTIVNGTRRTLDFAASGGVEKFLFVSSGAVYGPQPPGLERVPETCLGAPDPTDPNAAYGEGKRAAELLCTLFCKARGIEVKIARCFAFVGPHLPLDAHFAIGNFIRDALSGGPIRVKGDGTPVRSYLYAADLAVWLWTLLFQGTPGRACNVGSMEAVSIADLAGKVAAVISPETTVTIQTPPDPSVLPARYVPDTTRAVRELGLRVRVSLEEAIRRTGAWHRLPAARE